MIREAIINAMQSQQLTAYAVGKLAGIDPGTVRRYLDGKHELKTDTLEKVMGVLGLVVVHHE